MMHSLKDLLPDALRRGRIGREVATIKLIETFNNLAEERLPANRKQDVRAISYKDQILNVACKNNLAAHWVVSQELNLISALSRSVPEAHVLKIKPKNQVSNYDF
ncbi:MAG: hypothetical protein UX09_C0004G0007 [Candidatus Uhrbacteria bacterium GW2011_GWE2_45_35]|uniref:Uncharacterized protein n=2 Tax=Candidatus Uhriibacteriota TaxID=1752732 RepID=A0A0G1JKY1_9BACT|nr:MAG: hypothetical protein UW63_C0002G0021 [Candidatus Uhrbacteria bacterium GW2011_GWF2_44_350]KKU09087.1 MAG: hypothetical protein UX09_C0004G0007 [Candidatus Uhrbacteria bacterium GW2011_GWE2_45_35]HBR80338.1 hypothetical protein [Candidatus Uhrbacteria bacterium]